MATVIMGVAVVGLLSNLSTSLSNASRLTDYDRARLMAKRTMDEIMVSKQLPKGTPLEGFWDPSITGCRGRVAGDDYAIREVSEQRGRTDGARPV